LRGSPREQLEKEEVSMATLTRREALQMVGGAESRSTTRDGFWPSCRRGRAKP